MARQAGPGDWFEPEKLGGAALLSPVGERSSGRAVAFTRTPD